jgi:hypothetical protein
MKHVASTALLVWLCFNGLHSIISQKTQLSNPVPILSVTMFCSQETVHFDKVKVQDGCHLECDDV